MHIAGLQKMTLLDFPGKVACTVFLRGCNLRCPFCHNGGLLGADAPEIMEKEGFFAFLESRKGLLDGVCVSGGEPTLSAQLPDFLRQIKAMGFAVKLDTNGSRPQMLEQLLRAGLVDYVAMDVKNCPDRLAATVGVDVPPLTAFEASLGLLFQGNTDYELRTTVVHDLHSEDAIQEMGKWLHRLNGGRPVKKIFLQPFVNRDSVLDKNLLPPENQELSRYIELLYTFAEKVAIRG